jgi:hypothetical protein
MSLKPKVLRIFSQTPHVQVQISMPDANLGRKLTRPEGMFLGIHALDA